MDSTNFARMDLFIELKSSNSEDGFDDSLPFEALSSSGTSTRGQLAFYAAAQMTTQFRTHVFSVLLCRTRARFIRWDRAGAIVTKSFNYVENPRLLVEFFWNYTRLPSGKRGYDSTVSPATDAALDLGSSLPGSLPLLVLEIPPVEGSQMKKVVVRRPEYTPDSPFGRATRALRAIDLETEMEVFVKDYWRRRAEGVEKEGDIYQKLHLHKVQNIATFYCGNDIQGQTTLTQDCGDFDDPVEGFEHYRMGLLEVGRRLTEFKSTQELVLAIADAMEGKRYVAFALCLMYDTKLSSKRSPPGCFRQGGNITPRHQCRKHRHHGGWERDVDRLGPVTRYLTSSIIGTQITTDGV
jgi:Fungal protein kinase